MHRQARGGLWGLLAVACVATIVVAFSPFGCAGTPPCALNSDCLAAYCVDGDCVQDCVDSKLDCPHGYVCGPIGKCEYHGAGDGGATSASASSGFGGDTTASSTSAPSASSSTGTGGGALHELDLCSGNADCAAPLVCRALVKGGASRCTRTCASSATCMSGTRCIDFGNEKYCAGDDVGRSCTSPSPCNFGCLVGPKYCTAPCGGGADCPNGYGCMGVGSPPVNVCVRAEAYCSAQDPSACVAPAACDESPTLIIGGCTLGCSSAADCPRRAAGLPPWSCDGLCRRPADVHGSLEGGYTPAQYACDAAQNVVNLCDDGQHIDFAAFTIPAPPPVNCNSPTTTDGAPGDACVDSCRYQGGCAFGFACSAVGQVNAQRIGLCLPTGAGEVGAACSTDGQCAFGYCVSNKCSRDCTADGVCPSGSSCVAAGGPTVEAKPFRRCQ